MCKTSLADAVADNRWIQPRVNVVESDLYASAIEVYTCKDQWFVCGVNQLVDTQAKTGPYMSLHV